jgi:hypothetical protein
LGYQLNKQPLNLKNNIKVQQLLFNNLILK